MTGIVLHQPVLTLADDPDSLPLFLYRSEVPSFDGGLSFGEVRTYAGGERISTARAGTDTQASMAVVTNPAGLDLLRAWRGRTVCYRDGLGNKVFAVFYRHPWTPSLDGTLRYVSLTLQSVSYVEANTSASIPTPPPPPVITTLPVVSLTDV